jgi:flavorubredoxin
MARITEIAPDLFQLTTFVKPFNIQFSQFLVRDMEPLLFHTGPRALFAEVRTAVASLIDLPTLRWIGFSHFESDECATVPEWQQLAPKSEVVCSLVGKMVSVDDCLAIRPAKGIVDGEVLETGRYRFRFSRRRMCRIAGKQDYFSRRGSGRSCALIFSIKTGTSNR